MNLDGRVAIVTGAGRGLGREHALLLAAKGATVVVNDRGGSTDGEGADTSIAQAVVDEISDRRGRAIANGDSVADWSSAKRMIESTVETFGRLDILVNNAGILRDRMLVNMSEDEFDVVINVHVKGTFCPTRHAAEYWRERSKAGDAIDAAIVNTSSGAGLFNNVGQANYGPAKSAIATFSQIAAKELARYGVRVNTIAPMARTRLVSQTPGLGDLSASKGGGFDPWSPENISPLVVYLASPGCPFTGGIWHVFGGRIDLVKDRSLASSIQHPGMWTVEALEVEMKQFMAQSDCKNGPLVSESMSLEQVISELVPG